MQNNSFKKPSPTNIFIDALRERFIRQLCRQRTETPRRGSAEISRYWENDGHKVSRTQREYFAHIKVEQVPSAKSFAGELKTFARIALIDEFANFSRVFYRDSCGNRGNTMRDKITESFYIDTTQGTGGGEADSFQFSVYGDRANIGFSLPDIAGKYSSQTASRTTGFCNQQPPTSHNSQKDVKIEGVRYSHDVPVDPKNPNVLRGSMTIPGSKGWKLIFSWDLSRCQ